MRRSVMHFVYSLASCFAMVSSPAFSVSILTSINVLKEIIDLYRKLNGSVFVCFLDASKAFDRVNHTTLFNPLAGRLI